MNPKFQNIRRGDRVRVTFEGLYQGEGKYHRGAAVAAQGELAWDATHFTREEIAADTFKVEKIDPPLAKGEIVQLSAGPYVVQGEIVAVHGTYAWVLGPNDEHYTRRLGDLRRVG